MAPAALSAATVKTITTTTQWQKSQSSTSVAVNAQTGVITVSSGGEVTQELANLVPGVYTLKFKTVSSELAIKILGKAGEATSFTTLKEGTIENEDGTLEFTVGETSTVSISVSKATNYFFGGAELKLNFDFAAEADALADTLASFKDNIKAYASDAAEGYDAQITALEAQIATIRGYEPVETGNAKYPNYATEDDSIAAYNAYAALKLYNDIEGVGETASDPMEAIKALRQNAFTAEKAYLEGKLAEANAILNDQKLYGPAADEETTGLRDDIAAAIAALEEGDATTAIQADLETLKAKVDGVKANSDAIKAMWNVVKTNLDALTPRYNSVRDWSSENLNKTIAAVAKTSTNGATTNVNKYKPLADYLEDELSAAEDSLAAYKQIIEQAYAAGTLFVTKKDGDNTVIDETKGLWGERAKGSNGKYVDRIEYKTVYYKLIEALGTDAAVLPGAAAVADKSYEAAYTAFKASFDTRYENFAPYEAAYKQACIDGAGFSTAAAEAAKTAMVEQWAKAYDEFWTLTPKSADWKKQDFVGEDHFGLTIATAAGTEAGKLGVREGLDDDDDNVKLVDKYYNACGPEMTYKEKYNAATAAYGAVESDYASLLDAWYESLTDDDKEALTAAGFNLNIWKQGTKNDEGTKAWVADLIKAQTDKFTTVNTYAKYGATANAAAATALDNWSTTLNGIKTQIDAYLKNTGTEEAPVFSGTVKTSAQTLITLYGKFVDNGKKVEALDNFLSTEGDANADDKFDLAYNDPEGIAFDDSEILKRSYKDQVDSIANIVTVFGDSIDAALAKHGKTFVDALTRLGEYELEADANYPSATFKFFNFADLIAKFVNLSAPAADGSYTAEKAADDQDVYTTHKLISNKLYTALKAYDQADAAATIKNIKAKEELIKEGVKELINKKDANGNVIDDQQLSVDEAKALYGPNAATDVIEPADALDKEIDAVPNMTAEGYKPEGILGDDDFADIQSSAVLVADDIDFTEQKIKEGKNPNTSDIDKYTAHLDNVLAQLKVIQSKALAASVAAAENEEFYQEGDGTTVVNGEEVAPKDLVAPNGDLRKYYESVTTTIERNDYRQYPGVKAAFATKYAALKDLIDKAEPMAGIAKLEKDIADSYAAGTLKEDWEKKGGFKEQIAQLHGQIDTLMLWANAAQTIYDAYMNVADAMADANIIAAATFDDGSKKLTFTQPTAETEKLLWKEVKTKIDALTNYDKNGEAISADGTAARTFFDNTALTELLELLWKGTTDAPEGLVQKLDSAFTDLSAYINETGDKKFDNDFVNIDEAAFITAINGIKDALMSLEAAADANNQAYAKQKMYAFGDTEEDITPIETLYYEIYTDISTNDHTDAATNQQTGYLKKLKDVKAKIDEQKGYNTNAAGWDQLVVKYKNGESTMALADSLETLYNEILQIKLTQVEGYDSAMAADNEKIHAEVLKAIADAEEAYEEAVKVQESFAAKSEVLADAIDKAEAERLAYNAELKKQKDALVDAKNKYNGTGAGSYTKWCQDHLGESYATDGAKDKKTFDDIKTALTNKMNTTVSAIKDKALDSDGFKAVKADADTVKLLNDWAANFKLENTDAAKAANTEMRENVTTGFGYIHYFDKDGKLLPDATAKPADGTEQRAGYLKLAQDLIDAAGATEFSLKDLDEALAAIPAEFKENMWSRYNAMADNVLTPLKNKAAGVYADGEEYYLGEESTATEEEQEAWKTAAKKYTDAENKNGAKDLYDAAIASANHNTQIGGQTNATFTAVKTAFENFLKSENNPYVKTTDAAEAQAKAAEMVANLLDLLEDQKEEIAKYGANGDMQAKIKSVEDDIEKFLNSSDSKKLKEDSVKIENAIINLAPNQLAQQEYDYVSDQITAVKQQYNTLEANGDENAAAAKAAVAELEKKLKEQKGRIDLYKNPGDKPVLRAQNKGEEDADYQKVVDQHNKDLAAYNNKMARLQAACDSLLALEDTVAEKLTTYADLAGVSNDSIVEVLQTAIDLAQDKADAAKAAIDAKDDLSDEQKEAFKEEIAEAEELLAAAQAALDQAEEDGDAIVQQNAIQQLIDAAEGEVAATAASAAAADGDNAASNAAAKAMLEGPAQATYFTYTVKALEDAVEAIEKELAKEDGKYQHADEADYASALTKIKSDIANLRTEVEEARDAFTADKYMKKKEADYVFKKKGDKINTAIGSLTQLLEESEIGGFIESLGEQIAELEAAITPEKYNAKDYAALQKELQNIKDALYDEGTSTMPWIPATPTGLVVDAKKLNDGTETQKTLAQLIGTDDDALAAKTAKGIQNAIDALEEDAEAKAIIDNPDEPGDIAGDIDGDGFVTSDDVEQFLDDLLYGNLPEEGDDEFDIYDVNGDGLINIADAQGIQNLSLGLNVDGSVPSDEAAARRSEAPAGNVTAETTQLQNGAQRITLTLSGNFDWTGFQMDVKGAEVLSETASLSLRTADKNGTHRIVAFGAAQGNGQVITLDVQGNAKLGTITFTTLDAQAVSFKLSGTTGIYGITTESSNVFYDLSGKIVKGMKKGVNIIRDAAGKAKKAIMK